MSIFRNIFLLLVQAECALTVEMPSVFQLLLPCNHVIQGVDIGDECHTGNVPGRNILGSNHSKLPTLEDHGTVWNTRVVEQAGHQVHTCAKVFRGGGSEN